MAPSLKSYQPMTEFLQVVYLANGGTKNGENPDAPLGIGTTSFVLWSIPAGTLIEKMFLIIDVLITGTTVMDVGDDDGATSYIPNAAITLGTVGMYGWDAKAGGAYLRIQTAGATDAGDIYVVPSAKFYSVATKSVKMACTTANTAGKCRVVIAGKMLPNPF